MTVWPQKLALVGAGKMGSALLRGWLEAGLPPSSVALVIEPSPAPEIVALAAKYNFAISAAPDNPGALEVIVLAVKPQTLETAAPQIVELAGAQTLIVSIIAGKTFANLAARLPNADAFVRAMPNTPATVGAGVTGAVASSNVTPHQREIARTLFSAVGAFDWLPSEDLVDTVTAVSGSGPAYVFALAEALAQAGAAAGLPPTIATRFARATVEGAGELMRREPDVQVARLRENVTSTGGTTAAGLAVLQAPDGLGLLMRRVVDAARKRAAELAG